jgi:hypothetical protein
MNARWRPSYPLRSSTYSLLSSPRAQVFFTRRMMPDVSSLDPPQGAVAGASAPAPERTGRRPVPAAAMS